MGYVASNRSIGSMLEFRPVLLCYLILITEEKRHSWGYGPKIEMVSVNPLFAGSSEPIETFASVAFT